jgi:alpha-galactosidase
VGQRLHRRAGRQSINRWTGLLLPPELVGSHVGADLSHTTSRTHDLAFRAGTALFQHFGIEWDLTRKTPAERAELARWVALYKQLRGLLHNGRVVRIDHPDTALWANGVIAHDRSEAVFALAAVATPVTSLPGTVRLRGLDPDAVYRLRPLPPGDTAPGVDRARPAWMTPQGVTARGSVLEHVGVQAPNLHPEQLVLLHVTKEVQRFEQPQDPAGAGPPPEAPGPRPPPVQPAPELSLAAAHQWQTPVPETRSR